MSKGSQVLTLQRQRVRRPSRRQRSSSLHSVGAKKWREVVAAPRMALPEHVLSMQEAYGNQAVNDLLARAAIQPHLVIGPAYDRYEREANEVAARAVGSAPSEATPSRFITPYFVHREGEAPGTDESLTAQTDVEEQLRAGKGDGKPLPPQVRADMESRLGTSLGHVRVHTDGKAARLSRELRARAFTYGSDIYFGLGRYSPTTADGRRLLIHELVHVIQQSGGGRKAAVARAPDDGEERVTKPNDLTDREWKEIGAQGITAREWEKLSDDEKKELKDAVGGRLEMAVKYVKERPDDLSLQQWKQINGLGVTKEAWSRFDSDARNEIKRQVGNITDLKKAIELAGEQPSDLTFSEWSNIYGAGVGAQEWNDPNRFSDDDKRMAKGYVNNVNLSGVIAAIRERPTHGTQKGPELTAEQWMRVKDLGIGLDKWDSFTDRGRSKIQSAHTNDGLSGAVYEALVEIYATNMTQSAEYSKLGYVVSAADIGANVSGIVSAYAQEGSKMMAGATLAGAILSSPGLIGGVVGIGSAIATYRKARDMRGLAGERLAARMRSKARWGVLEEGVGILGGVTDITGSALSLSGEKQASDVLGAISGGLQVMGGIVGGIRSARALYRSNKRRKAAQAGKYVNSSSQIIKDAATFVAKNQGMATRGVSAVKSLLDVTAGASSLAGAVGGSSRATSLISGLSGAISSGLSLLQKKIGGDGKQAAGHADRLIQLFLVRNDEAAKFAQEVLGIPDKSKGNPLDELQKMALEDTAALKDLLIAKMAKEE